MDAVPTIDSRTPRGIGRLLGGLLLLVLVSWGVFAARIYGEFHDWGSPWVGVGGKDAGGGGAILGVSWLMPIAGLLLGVLCAGLFGGPTSAKKVLARSGIGLVVVIGGFAAGMGILGFQGAPLVVIPAAIVGAILAATSWPLLGKVLLAYGALVRIPIAVLTFPAVHFGWGTHMDKMPPEAGEMTLEQTAQGLAQAQVFVWIPATILFGMLFAGLAMLLVGRRGPSA